MQTSFERDIELKRYQSELQQAENERQTRFDVALKNIVETSEGRKVLKRILMIAPIDNLNANFDPIQMSFNEGRRSVTIEIYSLLRSLDKETIRKIQDEVI